ncbi:MAG TPA: carbon-nitrogen hydrolase family protein [Myxococcaceae bacterium]|jgi:predicted amidohydrolase
MSKFTVGLIQVNSGNEIAPNVAYIEAEARKARAAGAQFLMTPENCTMLGADRQDTLSKMLPEEQHPGLAAVKKLAKELDAWFLIGSLHIKVEGERCANRSYLIDAKGEVVARYDKIHMFDADLPGGEKYRESQVFRPGEVPTAAKTPWGVLGMTICYDLRFPHLYRALAKAGATMISIPASFTVPTGKAHWHVLMRARAIETGCFVFAPAQVGNHAGNRKTFGHSLVVAPWGEVLADAGDAGPGFITAEIDPAKITAARGSLPTLLHDKPLAPVSVFG